MSRLALLLALAAVLSGAARGQAPSALVRRGRELEELAQILRPIEERFSREDFRRLSPAAVSELFHQIWVKTRRAAALAPGDPGLARDLAELSRESRLASKAADQANVEYPLRPEHSRDPITSVRALGTRAAVKSALAHADRALKVLERVMRRFPLYTAGGAWGNRP